MIPIYIVHCGQATVDNNNYRLGSCIFYFSMEREHEWYVGYELITYDQVLTGQSDFWSSHDFDWIKKKTITPQLQILVDSGYIFDIAKALSAMSHLK